MSERGGEPRVNVVDLALVMGEHRDEHDKGAIQQADGDQCASIHGAAAK
jgi:hypothetical protein